eukprot:gene38899-52538_t
MFAQLRAKPQLLRFKSFPSIDAAELDRRAAARRFLGDYEAHFAHGRYVGARLPRLPFLDGAFDLVLCAHLLFVYAPRFDLAWHVAACLELVRVSAGEVRIHPVCGADGRRYPELAALRSELAEAVQELFPGTQVTIGPNVEDGFYQDFARDEPFSTDDFAAIEKRMAEIVDRDEKIVREVWERDKAIAHFKAIGEQYKAEIIEGIPADQDVTLYRQGNWADLCRGPHLPSTKHVGKAFKLTKLAGAYWRGDHRNPMLQRIYGTAWASDVDLAAYLHRLEEAEKRDHRKIGKAMDLFH